jgi:hypothetical protein
MLFCAIMELYTAPPVRGEPVGIERRAFFWRAAGSISTGESPKATRSALDKVRQNG